MRVRAEPHARNPLSVALIVDGEFAITKGVPELDRPVPGAGDNLTVVGGKGDRKNIAGMTNEAASGLAGGKFPQTKGLVPRGGESVGTVG